MTSRFPFVAPKSTPPKITEQGNQNPHLHPSPHTPHEQGFSPGPEVTSQVDLSVDLAPHNKHHLKIRNPVMIASGTFGYDGYGRGMTSDIDLGRLGGVIPKTVTRWPREGNPEPRWHPSSFRQALEAGETILLNSIGLTNPGIEAALSDLASQWAGYGTTVLFSLSADSVDQFGEMAAMSRAASGFQALELNLSCPNVENGAMFGHNADLTAAAVDAVKANTDLPVIAKLAPNVPNFTEIAKSGRGCRSGRTNHLQHSPGHGYRCRNPQARSRWNYWRSLRACTASRIIGPSVPDSSSGGRTDHRRRRHFPSRTRPGVHSGGCDRGPGRQRQPGGVMGAFPHCRRVTGVSGDLRGGSR